MLPQCNFTSETIKLHQVMTENVYISKYTCVLNASNLVFYIVFVCFEVVSAALLICVLCKVAKQHR